jgi:alanyl-tRNA synthetase
MLIAKEIIDTYIKFFEKREHKQIANSPLVPENDPTTLFTSSGMQPLVPYLLGETNPSGKRIVNVQNCFRAQDIDEVGDNRHTTFFRMLGNWSLGEYFKSEEIPWLWEFLTEELKLPKAKLFITVFGGYDKIEADNESFEIWSEILKKDGFNPDEKIFFADVSKNWWSRSGVPSNMPIGEPGGPDTEVYFRFDSVEHSDECKGDSPAICECGKFLEIANSVFMEYVKKESGFEELPQKNVDFGGGLERLLAAVENKPDIFQTSLFSPIIKFIEETTQTPYKKHEKNMQIVADHFAASVFIVASGIIPSNKEQGYVLRRLIRRGLDNFYELGQVSVEPLLHKIVEVHKDTNPKLQEKFEAIKNIILEEEQKYQKALSEAKKFVSRNYPSKEQEVAEGGEIMGTTEIKPEDAFNLYSSWGLSPTQIKSMGYTFNEQAFAEFMEKHKNLSRSASSGMFKGGLADTSAQTIMGHTATHLLHQALRDIFGKTLHQTGSNITSERIRFDFNLDRNLTPQEAKKVENIVNEKIKENLPVRFEIMPLAKAKQIGAIGLFDEKYQEDVKVYFVGDYSKEFCGGPHVDFTGELKSFTIIKVDNIGKGQRRIYAKVN